jgi:hypothetical protein
MFECFFVRLQQISDFRDRTFRNFIMNRAKLTLYLCASVEEGVVRGVAPFILNLGINWV